MKTFKKILGAALALTMLAGCSSGGSTDNSGSSSSSEDSGKPYKAALLVNGTLGDKSFFDSANSGLEKLKEELGADKFDYKVEQMGGTAADESKWAPTLMDYSDSGEYDVIIVGTWQMGDALAEAAAQHPDQKYMYFDEEFDFEGNGNPENIYNMLYKQNEVSYLVGAAAAMMTSDESLENVDPSNKVIGFLGGMDNTVINDFLLGYKQGATDTDPDVEVQVSWVGDFVDSTKGKDLALTQYQNGVDVGYNVAGNAGLGQIEAAADSNRYAFGVDSDQAALLPEYAAYIPSSALKNIGNTIYASIKKDMDGDLEYGVIETFGLADGGVELVEDDHYKETLPQEIRDKIEQLKQDIIDGKIKVQSAYENR